jgi:hypothetical protein
MSKSSFQEFKKKGIQKEFCSMESSTLGGDKDEHDQKELLSTSAAS